MMTVPQVKCEGCKRVEIVREDEEKSHPVSAARKRLKKRCTRDGHISQPIYTAAFDNRWQR
jgi:hypothetical protein